MKKILIGLVAMVFLFAPMAFGLSYDVRDLGDTSLYTGTYLFTVTNPGNENNLSDDDIVELISAINSKIQPDSIDSFYEESKIDNPETENSILSVTYSVDEKTGTWTSDVGVQFYSVKGGTEWALYWLGLDGLMSGSWSTQHIVNNGDNQPEISHLTIWNSTSEVPEPATLLLFGAGITGLALYRRKRS